MYGDDFTPSDEERYRAVEKMFDGCETQNELTEALLVAGADRTMPRAELHILHKRTCLKKGWEV